MRVPPLVSDRLFALILSAWAIVVGCDLIWLGALTAAPPQASVTAIDWTQLATPGVIALAPGIVYEPNPSTGSAAWVAELVTSETLAGEATRPSTFRVDPYVAPEQRARDADYRSSGYDRGHLAAAANHANQIAATFSLANVVPQRPEVNQGPMKQLEESLRGRVDATTSLLIVTAPLYELDEPKRTAGRLPVPTAFVKAVIVMRATADETHAQPIEGLAYRIDNESRAAIQLVSIDQVESLLQRDLFSFLPDDTERRLEAGG